MGDDEFQDLVRRVRGGDETAAAELVGRYEDRIRRAVRSRLRSSKMKAMLDSVDVCQSVLANFFDRARAGEFEFEDPEDLVKLLVTMARNRLQDWERKNRAIKRDRGREVPLHDDERRIDPPAPFSTPSQIVAGRELYLAFRERLADEERFLSDERAKGRSWQDLAMELGQPPDALRMRLARAVDRVSRELGGE